MTAFDRMVKCVFTPWVILLFVGLMLGSFLFVDKPIALYFHSLHLSEHCPWLNVLTKLGVWAVYLVALFLLALFFRYVIRRKVAEERTWFLWICMLFASLCCIVLKTTLGRARPELLFDEQLYGFFGFHTSSSYWSFPSGHTTTIMTLAFGLCALFPRYWYAFISAGFLVASSRILLTEHYLSDVLASSYLALLEVGIVVYWLRSKKVLSGKRPCE